MGSVGRKGSREAVCSLPTNCQLSEKGLFLDTPSLMAPSLPQARLAALADQWQFLVQKSAEKSQKLKEANKQQNFNTGIKDFDFWLSEVMAGFPSQQRRVSGHLG